MAISHELSLQLKKLKILLYSIVEEGKEIILKDHVIILQESLDKLKAANFETISRSPPNKPHPLLVSRDISQPVRYIILLEKATILNLIELLSLSGTARLDTKYYLDNMRRVLQEIKRFNQRVATVTKLHPHVNLRCSISDICDVFVKARGCDLSRIITQSEQFNLEMISQWAETELNMITELMELLTSEMPSLFCNECNGRGERLHHECVRLEGRGMVLMCGDVNGRVWQEVGRRVVTCHSFEEKNIEQVLNDMNPLSIASSYLVPAHKCFWYIFNNLHMKSTILTTYDNIKGHLPLSSSKSFSSYSSTILPHVVTKLSHPVTSAHDSTALTVAMVTDKLRLYHPLSCMTYLSFQSMCQYVLECLRDDISRENIESVVHLLFDECAGVIRDGKEMERVFGGMIDEGRVVPTYTAQFLIVGWSEGCYRGWLDYYKWIESQFCSLCCLFFNQFDTKCNQIVNTNSLKSRLKQKDSIHSYINVLQCQILEPLLSAAVTMQSSPAKRHLLEIAISTILYHFRATIFSTFHKLNTTKGLILKSDYNEIIGFLKDQRFNALDDIIQHLIGCMRICIDIQYGLELICRENDDNGHDVITLNTTSNGEVWQLHDDNSLMMLTSKVEIMQKIQHIDVNHWKSLL